MLSEILLATTLTLTPCTAQGVDTQYNKHIYSAVNQYWAIQRRPYRCWLLAVLIAESNLDPSAVSHADAHGIAQFLPTTWREQEQLLGIEGSPYDAHLSIIFAANYMERLARIWSAPRTERCRLELQSASYNAGAGNVIEAQRLARGATCWDKIGNYMVQVTGSHSSETLGYVARISQWFKRLTE